MMGHGSAGEARQEDHDKTILAKCLSEGKKVLSVVLAQWLVIGFGLSCLLAYFFPSKTAKSLHCWLNTSPNN
jgi:sodium/bile acid cotransporter 7